MSMSQPASDLAPLFSFGVVADIQYSDRDDIWNFHKTARRFHRSSILRLETCVQEWIEKEHSFALQLGDAIDGHCRHANHHDRALETVTGVLDRFPNPIHHSWGNHEFYNFPKEELMRSKLFSGPPRDVAYYDWSPHKSFRFVFYDPYDVSMLAYEKAHPTHKHAHGLVVSKNANTDLNNPDGLHKLEKRFVQFNGAMSETQLGWLREILQGARERKENVILCGHVPLLPGACQDVCLLWNYDEVLSVLHEYRDCVVAVFSGHDHDGGFRVDPAGIHHVVFPALLEAKPGEQAHGHVYVYDEHFEIQGPSKLGGVVKIPRKL